MSWSVALSALYLLLTYVHAHFNIGGCRNVETQGGTVRGHLADDGDYIAYLGIPYAAPPVGKNRFKAPLPPRSWNGIYDANRIVKCPQNGEGDEDCLILNIFTPIEVPTRLLPVLFYIHEGALLEDASPYKGVEPLINENVIIVTINFRLGALGFLCLGIEEAPGNAGLKDQVAALKWVQNNIANFGGDPSQVTIYGLASGAASAELHTISNMSNRLFQKVIVESGCSTSVWTIDHDPIKTAMIVADKLHFSTDDLYELAKFYQRVPADILSKVNFNYYEELTGGEFGFVASVERKLHGVEPFLTESPYVSLTNGNFDKVPMMFFFETSLGLHLRSADYYIQNYKERMEENFADFIPKDLIFDSTCLKNEVADYIKYFYFGDEPIGDNNIIQYLDFFGDYLILHGLLNSVEKYSKNGNPVYLLEFAYKGNLNRYEEYFEDIEIAGFGDLMEYVFLSKPVTNKWDDITVRRVAKLIANFVKLGNPIPRRTQLLPTLWPRVHPNRVSCLRLDRQFEIIEKPYWHRKTFWDEIYAMFRRIPGPVNPDL